MISILYLSLCLSIASATNINYTDITPTNFTELQDVNSTVPGLNHLFTMTTNFVNVVFQPFSVIEEFLFSVVSTAIDSNEDPIQNVLSQWQTLATFEVGFVTCFVAGCLFIVFVPLVGLIMCCCRTCCSNCGGEMQQSVKRAKSSWRLCISASLLICTIFIAVPCVFVYLTNEWASDALRQIPPVTDSALDDLSSYITDVPRQLDHVIGEFSKLDDSIREDVDTIGSQIGDPVRDEFLQLTTPTLDRLAELSNLTQQSLNGLEDVQTYTTELNTGVNELNAALVSEKSSLDADLNNAACDQNPICVAVQSSTVLLNPSGADFSAVASIQSEIDNMNETLNQYDIDGQASDILQTINDIPESVVNSSTEITSEILGFLTDINSTLVNEVNNLPLETIDILGNTISNVSESISSALTQYNEQYDIYRYIAGALLASMVAIVVAFYWLGICCGTVSYSPYPSERSGCSNCGGILVMAGVGFTFIFSWLLMILVVIFFTIGGHSERYLCQNMESPYEGLKFVDKFLPSLLNLQIDGQPFNVSLYTTITECEKNASIYTAGGIDQILNITGLVDTALTMVEPFRDQINNFTLDLSQINTYPPELEDALNSMKDTGFSSINFTTYIEQIDRGLTTTNLTEYAVFLNSSADNMTAPNPLLPPSQELLDTADLIRAHSYNITLIQTDRVDPLSTTLTRLNDSVRELETTASGFNETVDSLATSLQDLNNDIANNGSAVVSQVVSDFGNEIIDDAIGFMDYISIQITERFGACRPLFLVYAKMTSILCSYLVEILNGFWFSLGWCVAFLIPSAILAMKLAKFYRVMSEGNDKEDVHWDEMEMESMHNANNNNKRLPSAKLRSSKVHPAPTPDHYY